MYATYRCKLSFLICAVLIFILLPQISSGNDKIMFKGKGVIITKDDIQYKKDHLPAGFTTTDEEIQKVVLMNRLFALEAEKKWGDDADFQKEIDIKIEQFKASKYRKYLLDQIDVSDKVLKSYFIANSEKFNIPEKYNFKMIITFSSYIAESIVKDIKNGVDSFENYAMKMSLDKATGKRGGEVGWIEKNKLPPLFANHLSNCQKNTICEPFQFHNQWVILSLIDQTKTLPAQFDERVKKEIREKLIQDRIIEITHKDFQELMKEYGIVSQ